MDILKVVLFDTVTGKEFIINAAGELEVSIASVATNLDSLDGYKISDIDADASPNYYGFLRADGAWYILKETIVPGDDTYRYVAGSSSYTWSGRTGLSYVTFDSAF